MVKIALDSNCLTYLINACKGKLDVDSPIAEEGVALIRVWFYLAERYFISRKVLEESQPIRDKEHRATHLAFADPTYFGLEEVNDPDSIEARANLFYSIHRHEKDCRVLAEAEDMGVEILFSYDNDFIKKLGEYSDKVRIMRPSDYWQSLQLPRGTAPKLRPHETNPLAKNTFWLW